MPPNHAFVRGWSKEWFIAKASEVGPATAEAAEQIMNTREHVQQGFNAVMGVLRLANVYSPQRLERACQRATYFKSATFKAIKAILEQNLDKQTFLPLPVQNQPPSFMKTSRDLNITSTSKKKGKPLCISKMLLSNSNLCGSQPWPSPCRDGYREVISVIWLLKSSLHF